MHVFPSYLKRSTYRVMYFLLLQSEQSDQTKSKRVKTKDQNYAVVSKTLSFCTLT